MIAQARATAAASGWEFVHVAIDDHSRIACAQVMPNEKKESAVAFLKAAVAYYRSLGVKVERVMTDNGCCYRSKAFRRACKRLGLRHIRTRPYTPQDQRQGRALHPDRLREWAYAYRLRTTQTSEAASLPIWLHRYNWHRPHASLDKKTPISRLGLTEEQPLEVTLAG